LSKLTFSAANPEEKDMIFQQWDSMHFKVSEIAKGVFSSNPTTAKVPSQVTPNIIKIMPKMST